MCAEMTAQKGGANPCGNLMRALVIFVRAKNLCSLWAPLKTRIFNRGALMCAKTAFRTEGETYLRLAPSAIALKRVGVGDVVQRVDVKPMTVDIFNTDCIPLLEKFREHG